jgi:hypothetical protein
MFSQLCLVVLVFETCLTHTVPSNTYGTSRKLFCHTPAITHSTPQLRLRPAGQCLLPQTSSLATCDSTLGGLPSGLGTLCSGLACANILLTRVYRRSLCGLSVTLIHTAHVMVIIHHNLWLYGF